MESWDAIERGEIKPGDVIVIRYEGCVGAPGMTELMSSTDALLAKGLRQERRTHFRCQILGLQLRALSSDM